MVDQIDLLSARRETPLAQAMAQWNGFVTLEPGEASLAPTLRLVAGSTRSPAEFARDHAAMGKIPAIGCHFLSDVTYSGMLYPFQDGKLLDDGSHLSRVSADWLDRYPRHRPGCLEDRAPVVLEGPIVAAVGPGHQTYGHWIIDFLPRISIARDILGPEFEQLRFLVLTDTPDWAKGLLLRFFDIGPERLIPFELGRDEFRCKQLCYPSYAHSYPFNIHSYLKRFYRRVGLPPLRGHRRLCIQRRTQASGRAFERQVEFERLAIEEGYKLVDPQSMPYDEQVALFAHAAVVIGEYGSALHNSVYSPDSTVFGVLNAPGIEQTKLCAAFGQSTVYVVGDVDDGRWTLSDEQLRSFFATMRRATASDSGGGPSGVRPYPRLRQYIAACDWQLSTTDGTMIADKMRLGPDGTVLGSGLAGPQTWQRVGRGIGFIEPETGRQTVFDIRLDLEDSVVVQGTSTSSGIETMLCLQSSAASTLPGRETERELVGAHTIGAIDKRLLPNAPISIGKFCVIAANVTLVDAAKIGPAATTFPFAASSFSGASTFSPRVPAPTTIGNDVTLETGVFVEAGVTIGDGAVILAGSVVRQPVAAYMIAGGNPAVIVAARFSGEQIARLCAICWWNWPEALLDQHLSALTNGDIDEFLAIAERL